MIKCCDYTAGMLRHSVIIERQTSVQNNTGGQDISWTTHKTAKASIKAKSGSERVRGMQLESPLTHTITFRYIEDVTTKDRINFNGRMMQIRAVVNIEEANRWTQLSVEEGVAQ